MTETPLTQAQVLHLLELGLGEHLESDCDKPNSSQPETAGPSRDQQIVGKPGVVSRTVAPAAQDNLQWVAVPPESPLPSLPAERVRVESRDEAQEAPRVRAGFEAGGNLACGPLQTPLGIEAVLAKFYTDYAPAAAHGLEIQPQDYTQE